jgi:hypothetical protein
MDTQASDDLQPGYVHLRDLGYSPSGVRKLAIDLSDGEEVAIKLLQRGCQVRVRCCSACASASATKDVHNQHLCSGAHRMTTNAHAWCRHYRLRVQWQQVLKRTQ